jgi:DNA repair photolyase
MLGGGVGDSYQPVEKYYQLTRKTLELIYQYGYPVHILTKSSLIERDLELLQTINSKYPVIVSMSFSSVDNHISRRFEPGVPIPSQRLQILKKFKQKGIATGMFLLPVIPFITDTEIHIRQSLQKAEENGIDFVIFGGMTLKIGRQQQFYFRIIKDHYPELLQQYQNLYQNSSQWGMASQKYYQLINKRFNRIRKTVHIPCRIPPQLYTHLLSDNDRIIVILEHLDYLLKLEGKKSSYGYIAYQIAQQKKPISSIIDKKANIKGVGPSTKALIQEILQTGTSHLYQDLLFSKEPN